MEASTPLLDTVTEEWWSFDARFEEEACVPFLITLTGTLDQENEVENAGASETFVTIIVVSCPNICGTS